MCLAMCFITKQYLNTTPKRKILIELIFGKDNEWYRLEKKFDFVMANAVLPGSTVAAWRMKKGIGTKRQRAHGAYAFPNLHVNHNYLRLLDEFPFFVRWEFAKAALAAVSFIALAVALVLEGSI